MTSSFAHGFRSGFQKAIHSLVVTIANGSSSGLRWELLSRSLLVGITIAAIPVRAQIKEPVNLVSSDDKKFTWNGFSWGQSWESIKALLPSDYNYFIYDKRVKDEDINDLTEKSYVLFRVEYNNRPFTISFSFYGNGEHLQQIKLKGGDYLFSEDITGEKRERSRIQQRQLYNNILKLFNDKFDYGEDIINRFNPDKSGMHDRAWTFTDTLIEVDYKDNGPKIEKNGQISALDITYSSMLIAEQKKLFIPKKPVYDAIREKGIRLPVGTTATAKLEIPPADAPKDVDWNCVIETTSPFFEDNGTAHGPERIRFMIKLKPGTGDGSTKEANWWRKQGDSKIEMYRGSGAAIVKLKKSNDGSIKKSENRELKVIVNEEFHVKWYDSDAEFNTFLIAKITKEAEAGDVKAMQGLAFYYSIGYAVQKDEDIAMEWYVKAAKLGSGQAMNSIGEIYLQKKEYNSAFEWYNKAAEAGYYFANHPLGIIYYFGNGQPKNPAKAFEHFQIAATHGTVPSMKNLGIMYAQGDGTPKSDVMAYAWLSLAAAEDKSAIQLRDNAEKVLTVDQKAEAQSISQTLFAAILESRKKEKAK
jgi:hypothetical protein